MPEADRVFVVAGNPTVSQGRVILRLKPWGERDRTQQEIGRAIAPQMVADSRRRGLSEQSAAARSERALEADQLRDPDLAAL